jgi:hypothetical protein
MKIHWKSILYFLLPISFWACEEEENIPPFAVNFNSIQTGITSDNTSAVLNVIFSRPAHRDGVLTLDIESGGLVYGEDQDFFTDPSANGNRLELPFLSGSEAVTFKVLKGSGLNIRQDEALSFQLADDAAGIFTSGQNNTINVLFSENFVATDGIVELNAGGEDFTQKSYLDLSKQQLVTVDKNTWDLGFYSGDSQFAVILNGASYTMARPLEKNDLTAVSASDTLGFGAVMTIPPPGFRPDFGSVAWIDAPDGDLSKTAIEPVATNAAENKVYIIRREGNRPWKKIRVLRNGNGYILQYADIGSASFSTLELEKDPDFNFLQVNLDEGLVDAEPKKILWDLMYGSYSEILPLGPSGSIPYGFKDYIVINRYQTEAALVMENEQSFEGFSLADVSGINFSSQINAIGANWRQGGGPDSAPSILRDRFFVLKDSQDNYYKIKFTRLTSTTGERGYPELIYELLK